MSPPESSSLKSEELTLGAFAGFFFVIHRIPHRIDEANHTAVPFRETDTVRRLNLQNLFADRNQILGTIGQEDTLLDLRLITGFSERK